MKSRTFRVLIILFWLCMMAWFVRYEAFPDRFTHSARGYRSIFAKGVMVKDTWMRILFKDQPVGFTHTEIDMDEKSVSSRYLMRNEMVMYLMLMGSREKISSFTRASLDAMYRLQNFSMEVHSRAASTRVEGKRVRDNIFYISVITGGSRTRTQVEIPDDTILYSPMTDVAVAKLKPGQRLTIKTLDPITMSPTTVMVKALEDETIDFRGKQIVTRVLATEYMGMTSRSWLTPDGRVLRQETPLRDFIAEACEAEEAIRAGLDVKDAEDILKALSIKSSGVISDPENTTRLVLKIDGAELISGSLDTERQSAVAGEDATTLTSLASVIPEQPAALGDYPDELKKFTNSTAYIQAAHPRIIRRAQKLTKKADNSLEAARSIFDWVHQKVYKTPAPGIPSALEVLNSMQGDCNEHTYLFTALARAANLPTKVKVGVMYMDGSFYYHAWPSVYVGQWLEMDPTSGQPAVDATHIALFEGELADQLGLIRAIGRINFEILEQEQKSD